MRLLSGVSKKSKKSKKIFGKVEENSYLCCSERK